MTSMNGAEAKRCEAIILSYVDGRADSQIHHSEDYFKHILCEEGTAEIRLENKSHQVRRNDIVICLPSTALADFECSEDFRGICLFVAFDLLSKNNPDIGWGIKAYLFSKENPVVHLSSKDVQKCLSNFNLLYEKYNDNQHRFQHEILNLQLQMFVMDMWNIFSMEIERRNINNQKGSLFERFLQLVQEHCMQKREVEFYAEKLFITPKYLTEVCKKSSGKTASEWIQNYTTQRLILLLENKNLDFAEIADKLNFSSPSFFSRYVRKVLGLSPSEYRQQYK